MVAWELPNLRIDFVQVQKQSKYFNHEFEIKYKTKTVPIPHSIKLRNQQKSKTIHYSQPIRKASDL